MRAQVWADQNVLNEPLRSDHASGRFLHLIPRLWSMKSIRHEHDFRVERFEANEAIGQDFAIEIAVCRCEQTRHRLVQREFGMVVADER